MDLTKLQLQCIQELIDVVASWDGSDIAFAPGVGLSDADGKGVGFLVNSGTDWLFRPEEG